MTIFKSHFDDIPVPDCSVTERVFQTLVRHPDRVVLIDGPTGREVTAGQMMEDVKRFAGGLTEAGFGAGHTVALMAPNMPEYFTVFHGVAWAGGTVTTINPTYTEAEVRHQLNDSRSEILVTVPAFLDTAQAAIAGTGVSRVVVIGQAEGVPSVTDMMGPAIESQIPVDPGEHIVVLPYSSGTTGLPKGVMLSHENLTVNIDQTLRALGVEDGETTIAFLPFFHIYGMNVMMNTFIAGGATLVTMPRFDLEAFLTHAQNHKVRQLCAVPPVALAMAKHPIVDQFDLSALEVFVSAAAPLGAELSEACGARLNCAAVQGYGMTELSPVSHFVSYTAPRAGAVGRCLPNTESMIVDVETGRPLGVGQEGELWIRGPQVMKGYLNNARATAETIDSDGWLHTGDIARFDEEGYLYICDRLKELIKVKGFQVAPAEIEAVLQSHADVADAAVIGVPDDEAGEAPMAFIVPMPGATVDFDGIAAFLGERLASFKVPKEFAIVAAIPKSASGKILRRLLRDGLAE